MTKQLKEIEIPLGANDSELCHFEYTIPEGMEATIVDNKIVIKKKDSEDEKIRKEIIEFFKNYSEHGTWKAISNVTRWIAWLEKQGNKDKLIQELGEYKVKYTQEVLEKCLNKKDDERLRKELIEYFRWNVKQILNDFSNKECIAWLEKQDKKETNANEREIPFTEQNPVIIIPKFRPGDIIHLKDSCAEYTIKSISNGHYYGNGFSFNIIGCDRDYELIEHNPTQKIEPFKAEHSKYYYCIKDYFCGGKKQASKGDVVQALRGLPIMGLKDASEYFLPVNLIKCNSNWSKEDEEHLKSIISDIKTDMGAYPRSQEVIDIYNDDISFLKSIKERIQSQPKQEWSEEDEDILQSILDEYKSMLKEKRNWLKSLKDRMQSQLQQELSKEDKNKLNHIIKVIDYNIKDGDYCYGHDGKDYLSKKEIIKFLKSLRYYNIWEPSWEQIIALDNARHSNPFNVHILDTLFHDLNKLRKE